MAWYLYGPMLALDATGAVVRSGTGLVFAESDTAFATPLVLQDTSGATITAVQINDLGLTQAFRAEQPEVVWKSGSFVVPLSSPKGMREITEDALSAVQEIEAAMAAMLAEQQKFAVIPNNGSTSGYAEGTIIARLPA